MEIEQRKGGLALTAAFLKWTALLSMLIDHTALVLLPVLLRWAAASPQPIPIQTIQNVYITLRCIGRPAFPLYLFLLVEGFAHTRSRGRYLLRLAAFALISEIPFDLAIHRSAPLLEFQDQNVFFTLSIGFAALMGMDAVRHSGMGKAGKGFGVLLIAVAAPVAAQLLRTDYGGWGVAALELVYAVSWLRDVRAPGSRAAKWYLLQGLVMVPPLLMSSHLEGWAAVILPLLCLYNGEKGRQGNRWFFYCFYPAHLLLLAGLRALLLRG